MGSAGKGGGRELPKRRRTVLLVEDDPQAIKLFSLYLLDAGYRVRVARTGEEALVQIAREKPSAIILDILLPTMDGWDLLTELKAYPQTRDIPVVVVSVLEQQTLGFHLGAVEYLVKPVERTQLLRALRRCHLHRSPREPTPRVMIGHDDPRELELLARFVDQAGYDVIRALGGTESVSLAKTLHPDVIVMDLWRSRIEWFDVVASLRAEPAMGDVVILVLTDRTLSEQQRTDLCEKFRSIVITGHRARRVLLNAIKQALHERKSLSVTDR